MVDTNLPIFEDCDVNKDYDLSLIETGSCLEFQAAGSITEDSFNDTDDDKNGSVSFLELLDIILDSITETEF